MKKVRVGIVGVGGIANGVHIPGYLKCDDCEITAICDIDEKRLKETGDRLNIPETARFTDYRDLINSGLVDAVDIATSNDVHVEISLAALEAGAQTALQQDVQPKLHAPWRRFFARMIDLLLYDLTWMVILTSAGLCAAGNRGVTLLNDFLALLTMLLLEPLLLQKTGTTLGKWLLGLSVRNLSGAKLRYSEGLDRTARLRRGDPHLLLGAPV